MRSPTQVGRGGVRWNMTPMIDVSFLLIIFFLVSSHLAQQEVQLELDLPEAASGESLTAEERRRLVFNLLGDGSLLIGGQPILPDEIEPLVRYEQQRSADLEVRIRSDRQVLYGRVEPLLVACARAGVWNVTFSVVRREPGNP